ncbi:hypothetical protein SAMN05421748_10751 [Paractinoplanes atraurantiacus]|uniref:Uncharacterized protein n=1 Tax=Paractinoplanes atraurantiacus TaxID=1036182 RepID=A0A285I8Z4_9ACTN|nr:hypothetical protein SAMN05421748_10751 [Actinoplanes atraurantiacus]
MAQMGFFSRSEIAAMRDWTGVPRHSPDMVEIRRDHAERRRWGLKRRHAAKLCQLHGCSRACGEVGLHDSFERIPPLIWDDDVTRARPDPEVARQAAPACRAEQPVEAVAAPQPEPPFQAEPAIQAQPAFQAEPAVRTEPAVQAQPAFQAEQAVQTGPAAQARPAIQVEQAVQAEPAAQAQPTVQAEPAAQAQPTVPTEPAAQAQPTVQAEPAAQAQPTVQAEPAAQAQPAFQTEPAVRAEPAAFAGPAAPAKGAARAGRTERCGFPGAAVNDGRGSRPPHSVSNRQGARRELSRATVTLRHHCPRRRCDPAILWPSGTSLVRALRKACRIRAIQFTRGTSSALLGDELRVVDVEHGALISRSHLVDQLLLERFATVLGGEFAGGAAGALVRPVALLRSSCSGAPAAGWSDIASFK